MKKRGFILTAVVGLGTLLLAGSCAGGAHICDAYGAIEVAPANQINSKKDVPNLHSLSNAEITSISPKS